MTLGRQTSSSEASIVIRSGHLVCRLATNGNVIYFFYRRFPRSFIGVMLSLQSGSRDGRTVSPATSTSNSSPSCPLVVGIWLKPHCAEYTSIIQNTCFIMILGYGFYVAVVRNRHMRRRWARDSSAMCDTRTMLYRHSGLDSFTLGTKTKLLASTRDGFGAKSDAVNMSCFQECLRVTWSNFCSHDGGNT
jgi:hypothetical protein